VPADSDKRLCVSVCLVSAVRGQSALYKWTCSQRASDERAYHAAVAELESYEKRVGYKSDDLVRPDMPEAFIDAMQRDWEVRKQQLRQQAQQQAAAQAARITDYRSCYVTVS